MRSAARILSRQLGLHLLLALLIVPPLWSQERQIVTTPDSDYFGFDLRTEKDVTLDQCETVCLADRECRAFTYNTRARWCFLKSDFSIRNPFPGAIAGRVVEQTAEEDLGAPPPLDFVPADLRDQALAAGERLAAEASPPEGAGYAAGLASARADRASGNAAAAIDRLTALLAIDSQDPVIWMELAHAALAGGPEAEGMAELAVNAAINGYRNTRTAGKRAEMLVVLARALEQAGHSRPALEAYEASLALVSSPAIEAEYAELKARKGFRVIDHTVDADTTVPRACIQLSEDLVRSVDYSPFVTLDGRPAPAMKASGREICVEGLQHGSRYRVALRAGLPSAVGETLPAPVTLDIYVRDRSPAVRFTGENFVLPATARQGIPLVSVNTEEAEIAIWRIDVRGLTGLINDGMFLSQLGGYEISRLAEERGEKIWSGTLAIDMAVNEEVTTSFPIDEVLPQRPPGLYVMTAEPRNGTSESWEAKATQWFTVSDLGLSTWTGTDGLTVFVRSLATAKPLAGARLTLLARSNAVLGEATSDRDGRARFDAGLARGTAAMAPAALTAETVDGDFVFLDLTRPGFDLSDRGVAGRAAPGALDIFAWTERGIYRAGETVHAAALVRSDRFEAVERLPLTFIFMRPDGVEDRRMVSDGAALGGHAVDLPLTPNAMRGTWQLRVHADPKAAPLAVRTFLVEDFVPDRIAFEIESAADRITPHEPVRISVEGHYLYGAPAEGLALEGEVAIHPVREWAAWPGYRFGLADEEAEEPLRIPLEALPATDARGRAEFPVDLGTLPATTRLLEADIAIRMRESGGRAVERRLRLPIAPEGPMIGISPEFAEDSLEEGAVAGFRVIAVDQDGARIAMPDLSWSLVRIERRYQWYRQNGAWNYEPVTYTTRVADGTLDVTAASEGRIAVPVEWGRYRLEVEGPDIDGPATSVEFDAGWYVEARTTESPDGLEVALDKATYASGETARLKVSPRFAGELTVVVGADRILDVITATIPEEGEEIAIPVGEDWGAGAYVTAVLHRPGNAGETRMPMRAIGLRWLAIDPGPRILDVRLDVPAQAKPREALTIPVSVPAAAGEDAYVTVAAVDVGILNLTAYETPAPQAWYFGQRQLGLDIRDLYGRLIDGSLGATGRIRTGGDGGGMAMSGSPPTEELVAFFSGIVPLDRNGRADIEFAIPQFNGTVRVMAVAWSRGGVGSAEADIIVRDPVVVTASAPRFLAPDDRARLHLDIANTDGPPGNYRLSIQSRGSVAIDPDGAETLIALEVGGRATHEVGLAGTIPGEGAITVRLTHADGLSLEQTVHIPVRPATLPVATRRIVRLAGNGGALTLDGELLADSHLDDASLAISVTRRPAFDIPSLLMTLDRYPYGCAEQITSRALPLLYVSELSERSGLPVEPDLSERIEEAVHRVLAFQSSSGSFGLWAPGYGDLWLDAYVSDFLTRAREASFAVPETAMRLALDNLRNTLAYQTDIAAHGREIAYALYVLARNGKAAIGDLRYYADTQLEAFDTPLARAQIAAALVLYGDRQRAERVFASAISLAEAGAEDLARADYGSGLRDAAAMLALAAETGPQPPYLDSMIELVAERHAGSRTTSTQEQAWLLLAARALSLSGEEMALTVNGKPHSGDFARRLSGQEVSRSPLTIVNRGSGPVEAVVTAFAAPRQPLPAGGEGFSIERVYHRLDGTPVNASEVAQNERLVAVITVTEHNAWPSRILVSDLLPAGFEIDNPRLVGSADLANFGWLGDPQVAHVEFRNDRFIAAFDRNEASGRSFTFAYVVRAVTPGTYVHPAVSVEDMYRPHLSARTATGLTEVRAN
jgi:uncharacterized protein YfaS (alpha-2-macroglobulin family)